MRIVIAAALLLASAAPALHAQAGPHYQLDVSIVPATHRLAVDATITLPKEAAGRAVEFLLSEKLTIEQSTPAAMPAADQSGKGFVGINAHDSAPAKLYRIAVPADGVVKLRYSGAIDYPVAMSAEEYARGFKETPGIVEERGVYLAGSSMWYPNFGEALFTFDLAAHDPEGWQLIGVGDGTARDAAGVAHWRATTPVDELHLVGGPLQRYTQGAGAVEAQVYLHKSDDALAARYLEATGRYIEMYRGLIGPYPYAKFALVENFWETGYGMPSFTLLGPEIIRFPFIITSSYPHEILHNWWGNSVFVDYATGNWCEGLTAYMADHLLKEQAGQGAEFRRDTLKRYRDFARSGGDFPLVQFRSRHSAATEAVGYGKTAMGFHELRRRLGDERFRAAVQRFYRDNRGRRASFADVRRAFEATSGEDLGPFFRQWVERTGAPDLSLADVRVARRGGAWVVSGTLREAGTGPAFTLELPVAVSTAAGTITRTIRVEHREQPFAIDTAAAPQLLQVDPEFDVFRVLDARETAPSVGQLFGDAQAIAVLPSKADAAHLEAYARVLAAWAGPEHRIATVRDDEISALPADHGAWIFGRDNRFAAAVLGAAAALGAPASTQGLTLGGNAVTWISHSVALATRNPANPEKALALVEVDPLEAAATFGGKLPHYGKYSYLAFEGPEAKNVAKGEWQALDSPLRVDLRPAGARGAAPAPLRLAPRAALADLPPMFSEHALRGHVEWLADPAREGRGVGTAGLDASADYIVAAFRAAGLKPAGDAGDAGGGGYLQHFDLAQGPGGAPAHLANVIGYLPGSNPAFAGQAIVVSAHYDHLGRGWPGGREGELGRIHPGADDNASGIAVLLELAKAYAARGAPARTLVFAAFSGEESGLRGSRWYVLHPTPVALEGIRADVNFDTVGRLGDRELMVLASGSATEWPHVVRGVGFTTGIRAQSVPGAAQSSDQQSFIERGIPGVQFFSGAHLDYHRPSDTPDKIDAAGMVKVAVFARETIDYLLERPGPLTFTAIPGGPPPAAPATAAAAAAAPVAPARRASLGLVPDYNFQGTGVRADSVVPGSPAEAAGMQAGDVLVELGGKPVETLQAFSDTVKALAPGERVTAAWLRAGERRTGSATLVAR